MLNDHSKLRTYRLFKNENNKYWRKSSYTEQYNKTCYSSSIQLFLWQILLKQSLFSVKISSYLPVSIFNNIHRYEILHN
jgi:hypothetical protein